MKVQRKVVFIPMNTLRFLLLWPSFFWILNISYGSVPSTLDHISILKKLTYELVLVKISWLFFVRLNRSFYEQLFRFVMVYVCAAIDVSIDIRRRIYEYAETRCPSLRSQGRLFDGSLCECIVPSILQRPNQQWVRNRLLMADREKIAAKACSWLRYILFYLIFSW